MTWLPMTGLPMTWLPMTGLPLTGLPTAWHLGALHPVEQALTLVLAFGPFVVLAVVVWLRRRAETGVAETEAAQTGVAQTGAAGEGDQPAR